MTVCDNPGLMPLEQAMDRLLASVDCVVQAEPVPIAQALDRVLASDVVSPINVPDFDNSAMDGYALRADDVSDTHSLTLVGKSFAGEPFKGVLEPGQCVRIMTGAKMPEGADCVVMQENTQIDGDQVIFHHRPVAADNVRAKANDIARGDCLLRQGRRLSPSDIGLLASLGLETVDVYQPLKVALFSTGDELRLPGQALEDGCIYDSNRFAVAAMLERLGCAVINLGIIPDDPDLLRQTFRQAVEQQCHGVISSGGVSVGEADYTKEILEELGHIHFWTLAIKPGKPFAFGVLEGEAGHSQFFGLPGNPVSAMVTFHQLTLPCLQKMSGEIPEPPLGLSLPLETPLKKRPGRTDFQRGTLAVENGELRVRSTGQQSSGMLTSMSQSNCYLVLEQERGSVAAQERVTVIPYDRWIK